MKISQNDATQFFNKVKECHKVRSKHLNTKFYKSLNSRERRVIIISGAIVAGHEKAETLKAEKSDDHFKKTKKSILKKMEEPKKHSKSFVRSLQKGIANRFFRRITTANLNKFMELFSFL